MEKVLKSENLLNTQTMGSDPRVIFVTEQRGSHCLFMHSIR